MIQGFGMRIAGPSAAGTSIWPPAHVCQEASSALWEPSAYSVESGCWAEEESQHEPLFLHILGTLELGARPPALAPGHLSSPGSGVCEVQGVKARRGKGRLGGLWAFGMP